MPAVPADNLFSSYLNSYTSPFIKKILPYYCKLTLNRLEYIQKFEFIQKELMRC